MAAMDDQEQFVIDTHALWWYLNSPEMLTPNTSSILSMATAGDVTVVIPAIVVAELYYLSVKRGDPIILSEFMSAVKDARGFKFSDLGWTQLEQLDLFQEIPEMHDRLIAAESMVLDAPVITRDRAFSDSSRIETVW